MTEGVDNIQKVGFLNIDIDPTLDLFAEIEKLKIEKKSTTKYTPRLENHSCALLSRK